MFTLKRGLSAATVMGTLAIAVPVASASAAQMPTAQGNAGASTTLNLSGSSHSSGHPSYYPYGNQWGQYGGYGDNGYGNQWGHGYGNNGYGYGNGTGSQNGFGFGASGSASGGFPLPSVSAGVGAGATLGPIAVGLGVS
jgi:hypothetical protein